MDMSGPRVEDKLSTGYACSAATTSYPRSGLRPLKSPGHTTLYRSAVPTSFTSGYYTVESGDFLCWGGEVRGKDK